MAAASHVGTDEKHLGPALAQTVCRSFTLRLTTPGDGKPRAALGHQPLGYGQPQTLGSTCNDGDSLAVVRHRQYPKRP
jgi:hypothetical protein